MIQKLLHLLFPNKCILCQKIVSSGPLDICTECLKSLSHYPPSRQKLTHIAGWNALWHYNGDVRQSILRFKFAKCPNYGIVYGRYLANKLIQDGVTFDVLTWVPISAKRKWKRSYDHVLIIAQTMSEVMDVPLVCTLKKHRHTKPQSTLRSPAERRANVLGSYISLNEKQFAGKKVLLVDDIITTGATVSECARVLLTAGAKEVTCAAVASAIKNNHRNR